MSAADRAATFPANAPAPERSWARLIAGLLLYGVAVALMIASGRGLGPWDLLHQGLSRVTGLSVGVASQALGLVLVAVLWRAGARFGPGTLLNVLGIGLVLDLVLLVLPPPAGVAMAWGYHGGGIVLCGLATGLYIGAHLGAGPRDSLMMLLARRSGWPVGRVRTGIELAVLLAGWALGGTLGLGTLAFALGVGPAVQVGMRLFGRGGPPRGPSPSSDSSNAPATGSVTPGPQAPVLGTTAPQTTVLQTTGAHTTGSGTPSSAPTRRRSTVTSRSPSSTTS